jgi:hypothetical protein
MFYYTFDAHPALCLGSAGGYFLRGKMCLELEADDTLLMPILMSCIGTASLFTYTFIVVTFCVIGYTFHFRF